MLYLVLPTSLSSEIQPNWSNVQWLTATPCPLCRLPALESPTLFTLCLRSEDKVHVLPFALSHTHMHPYSDPLFNASFIFQLRVQSTSWFHQRPSLIFLSLSHLCFSLISLCPSLCLCPPIPVFLVYALWHRKIFVLTFYPGSPIFYSFKEKVKENLSATVSTLSFPYL